MSRAGLTAAVRVLPARVRLSRQKGARIPKNTVKVTRPGPFGNPFAIRETAANLDLTENAARHQVVDWFREWVLLPNDHGSLDDLGGFGGYREAHAKLHARLGELRGKNLACFCALDDACHADVLLELANRPTCDDPATRALSTNPRTQEPSA